MVKMMHEYISDLETQRVRVRYLRKAKMPEVGIYWVLPRAKLLIYSIPWTEALASKEGSRMVDWVNYGGHADYWEGYCKMFHLRDTEYTLYPRGRVIFNVVTKKPRLLFGSKIAKNKKLIKRIARAFNLADYTVARDQHYEDLTLKTFI